MTPDLMEAGAKRVAEHETLLQTASSGDREASFGRVLNGPSPTSPTAWRCTWTASP
jgi:hypothetical protein